jgi:thioredoxin 1
MSESSDDELERIREQKRKELHQKHGEGSDAASTSTAEERFDSPVEIDSESHLNELLDSESPVLVDCYADWCGPCQMMEPSIEALAAETPVVVAKVDVDAHQSLAGQLGVQGVPTLVLFVEGDPVERLVGAKDKATLERLIRQQL